MHLIDRYIQSIRNETEQQQATIGALQSGSSRIDTNQTSTSPAQRSAQIETINSNNNSKDPTLSLKRLLNIRDQNGLDNEPILAQQEYSVDLLPPSAFAPKTTTPPSSIGVERSQNRLSQTIPTINREQFRNVLRHLVRNDDHFFNMIHQTCVTQKYLFPLPTYYCINTCNFCFVFHSPDDAECYSSKA
jgi:hypothetical protein